MNWEAVKMLGDEQWARQMKKRSGIIKESIEQLEEYRTAVRANRQLAVVLRDQGLNEEADRFAYRAQRLQRIVLRRQGLLPSVNLWQRGQKLGSYLFSGFLDLLAGYGYHPAKTLFWYLFMICGFFPSLSSETNLHNPLVIFVAAEAVIGLFVEISFIATFTQRFFGK